MWPVGPRLAMAALAVVTTSSAVAGAPDERAPDTVDTSNFTPEMKGHYEVFALKCSKCHSLSRPLNVRLSATEWKLYLKKMIRRPGSGINEEAARRVYEFLKFYAEQKAKEE